MIIHADMDAFYASVEQRDRPELRGRPVVVGGSSSGRGVVCAASYEARKFGVHSAMSSRRAVALCPHAEFVRPRMEAYAEVSRQIREIFLRFTPLVQPLSLDEAFLDVAGSRRLFGPAEGIGRLIKDEVKAQTGLVVSVGVAPNKFLAKLASDLRKPDGFCVVPAEGVQDFLDPLEVRRVWGVGRAAMRKMERLGVGTIAELRRIPEDALRSYFGSWGGKLYRLARGIDERAVTPERHAKSISHETTFRVNVEDADVLTAWAAMLAELVARRLRAKELRARTLSVKIRSGDFETITRAGSFKEPTDRTRDLADRAIELVRTATRRDAAAGRLSTRLLGVGVSGFDDSGLAQGMLFEGERNDRERGRDRAADAIAEKFGKYALRPGSALALPKKERANPYEGQ